MSNYPDPTTLAPKIVTFDPKVFAPLRSFLAGPGRNVAAGRLAAWANETHAERPTREELRGWVRHVLDERDELHRALAAAQREVRDAAAATRRLLDQRGATDERVATLEREVCEQIDTLAAERDDLIAADERVATLERELAEQRGASLAREQETKAAEAEVEALRAQVDTLLDKRDRLTQERDTWQAEARRRGEHLKRLDGELATLREDRDLTADTAAVRGQALLARMLGDMADDLLAGGDGRAPLRPGDVCPHGVRVPTLDELKARGRVMPRQTRDGAG